MITILNSESGGDIEVDRFVNKVLMDMDDKGFGEFQQIKIINLLSMLLSELSLSKEDEDIEARKFAMKILMDMEDEGFGYSQQKNIIELLSEFVLEPERV